MATRSGWSSFGGALARAGPSSDTRVLLPDDGLTQSDIPGRSPCRQRGEPVRAERRAPGPDLALDAQLEHAERVVLEPPFDLLGGVGPEDQQGTGAATLAQGAADHEMTGLVQGAQVVAVPRAVLVERGGVVDVAVDDGNRDIGVLPQANSSVLTRASRPR